MQPACSVREGVYFLIVEISLVGVWVHKFTLKVHRVHKILHLRSSYISHNYKTWSSYTLPKADPKKIQTT